jgi:hypothetical protein
MVAIHCQLPAMPARATGAATVTELLLIAPPPVP